MIKKYWYWLIPLLLFLIQLAFTNASRSVLLFEELNESVRNVYWMKNGLLYDGISRNAGWYTTLLGVYRIFGFSLFTAKFYRLGLSLISLYALAGILHIYLKEKTVVPLVAIGLSPVFLYLSSMQAQYGLELQILPILVFLLIYITRYYPEIFLPGSLLAGIFLGISILSYASFFLYLPSLILIIFWLFNIMKGKYWGYGLFVLGMLLPVLLTILSVKNVSLLWHDPKTQANFLPTKLVHLPDSDAVSNWKQVYIDYFVRGGSYHFVLPKPDLSDVLPILTVAGVIYLVILSYRQEKVDKHMLMITVLPLILTGVLVVTMLPQDSLMGGRKLTPILVSFYGLYAIAWKFISRQQDRSGSFKGLMILMLLLPLHHLMVLPQNLRSFEQPNYYDYQLWFGKKYGSEPESALGQFARNFTEQDITLKCDELLVEEVRGCRYAEIFAALMGNCEWNNLECFDVYGYDDRVDDYVLLNTELWNDYYFPH